jgi:hypothetical protein
MDKHVYSVIKHMKWLDGNLLALGLYKSDQNLAPSLAVIEIEYIGKSLQVKKCIDLGDEVCLCEGEDYSKHKFFTHYLKPWYSQYVMQYTMR